MTRLLVATDSVHTTAAACDYLDGRLAEGDVARVVAVAEGPDGARDAADALNVAGVRRPGTETATLDGEVVAAIRAECEAWDAEELVVGARAGPPGGEGLGSTARALAGDAPVPVVVLPRE